MVNIIYQSIIIAVAMIAPAIAAPTPSWDLDIRSSGDMDLDMTLREFTNQAVHSRALEILSYLEGRDPKTVHPPPHPQPPHPTVGGLHLPKTRK